MRDHRQRRRAGGGVALAVLAGHAGRQVHTCMNLSLEPNHVDVRAANLLRDLDRRHEEVWRGPI